MTEDKAMAGASDLARRLAAQAEAVCRHYLSNGRRVGRYWLVGDVRNAPGGSMYVRLKGPPSGKGAAGHWTDGATAEYGDLLDVIRESRGFIEFRDVADEARRFLSLPPSEPSLVRRGRFSPASTGSPEAARRLFAMARSIPGTLAEAYLRNRGITALQASGSLRFHPRCYHRPDKHSSTKAQWSSGPAMIAAVTDLDGRLTGVHRTWLAPDGSGKAPVETPRRAMGDLLGHAVRFPSSPIRVDPGQNGGVANDVMAVGEGIETVLSLNMMLPAMPMAAALSAAHLAAILFPGSLRRLYIARDADPAGNRARDTLVVRAQAAGIEAIVLSPELGDFNEDLRHLGLVALRANLRVQLAPEDVARFLMPASA
jgi:hypothetical protein